MASRVSHVAAALWDSLALVSQWWGQAMPGEGEEHVRSWRDGEGWREGWWYEDRWSRERQGEHGPVGRLTPGEGWDQPPALRLFPIPCPEQSGVTPGCSDLFQQFHCTDPCAPLWWLGLVPPYSESHCSHLHWWLHWILHWLAILSVPAQGRIGL